MQVHTAKTRDVLQGELICWRLDESSSGGNKTNEVMLFVPYTLALLKPKFIPDEVKTKK